GKYHNFNDFFSFPEFDKSQSALKYESLPSLKSKIFDRYLSFFEAISQQHILLHFPYQSYDYVINFLIEAADDPEVKAIYITLYRVASGSGVIKALSRAAMNGKKVVACIEVEARFDEALNMSSEEEVQRAGVLVHYSFPGLTVHAKICRIRRLDSGINKYYAYFSTVYFHEKTAEV